MTTRGRGLLWGLVLFIYGTLVHYLLFNTHWGYGVPGDEPLVPHRVTWVFITFVGGVYFVVFMLGSFRSALGHASAGIFSTILRGGLFGFLATLASLETSYILTHKVQRTDKQRAYDKEDDLHVTL